MHLFLHWIVIVSIACSAVAAAQNQGEPAPASAQGGGRESEPGASTKPGSKPEEGSKKVPSLLKNGSFEGEALSYGSSFGSWTANVPLTNSTKYEFDGKFSCDGEQSLSIKNFEPKVQSPLSFIQMVSPQELSKWKSRELKLSACIKTEEAAFADVRVEAIDVKGKSLDWLSLTGGGVQGTKDWKRSEASLVVSEEIAALRVYCVLQGLGSAWFDDVRLTVVSLDKTKHLEPVMGESLDLFCRYMRSKAGSEERAAREIVESLRATSTVEMLRSIFAKGFSYPPQNGVVEEDLRLGGKTVYQVHLPSGYDTKKRWPMLLDLSKPGSGGQPWAEGDGKRFIVVRPKNLSQDRSSEGMGMSATAISKSLPAVIDVLRDARAKYAVDPDRVAVLGEAERADLAAAAALGYRGEVAAAVLIRPVSVPAGTALANGSGLAMWIATEGGERSPLAAGFESLKSKGIALQVRDLDPARVAAVAQGSEIFRWIESKTRNTNIASIAETLASNIELGSYWARVIAFAPGSANAGSVAGRIQGKIGSKRKLELTTEGIRRLRILISLEEMAQPGETEISVNGEVKYQGRPSFDFDVFLESLRLHADSRWLWGARVDIDVE